MKVTAELNNLRIAPRKVRLVTDLVKGMDVALAHEQLDNTVKGAVGHIKKLLASAVANGENNFGLDKDNLYIYDIAVGAGPMLTYHDGRSTLTLGFQFYIGGVRGSANDDWTSNGKDAVLIPSLGYSMRVSKRWQLFVEVAPPIYVDHNRDSQPSASAFTMPLTYGARVSGDVVYGEFGFMVPMSQWYYGKAGSDGYSGLIEYAPIGFPVVSLGFVF